MSESVVVPDEEQVVYTKNILEDRTMDHIYDVNLGRGEELSKTIDLIAKSGSRYVLTFSQSEVSTDDVRNITRVCSQLIDLGESGVFETDNDVVGTHLYKTDSPNISKAKELLDVSIVEFQGSVQKTDTNKFAIVDATYPGFLEISIVNLSDTSVTVANIEQERLKKSD